MTLLVAGETLLLGILSLLVVGLLRSHAEILRRLEGAGSPLRGTDADPDDDEEIDPRIAPPNDRALGNAASEIVGTTIEGDAQQIAFPHGGPGTLIAFLTSGCAVCREFWDAFATGEAKLPRDTRLVIVTKNTTHESPGKLLSLRPPGYPVIMSTAAWEAYEVPMAPYFVYVDGGTGRINGEGSASNWGQLKSLFTDYLVDLGFAEKRARSKRTAGGHDARLRRVDEELQAANILPGDPSLYEADVDEVDDDGEGLGLVHVNGRPGDANAG
jgi:hypothetical protein